VHSRLQRLGDQLRYVLLGNASLSVYVFIELSAVRQSATVMFLFVNRRVVRSAPDGRSVTGSSCGAGRVGRAGALRFRLGSIERFEEKWFWSLFDTTKTT